MNVFTIILLTAYLVIQAFEYWLQFQNLKHMKRQGMIVPKGFEEHVDAPLLKKTNAYTIEQNTLGFIESLFGNILLLLFLFGGLLNWYNSWVLSLDLSFVLTGTVFFLLLMYAGTALSIPFSLYSTFKIENKYGFNTMTIKLWIKDLIKSTLLSTVLVSIILGGAFWLITASPSFWWLYVWIFFFLFSIFMMYLSPYVIEPLFNKFSPIEESELEEAIRNLMKKVDITVKRIFKIDASKRSRHTNAYFTGIGKTKRIVLYDTLMERMSKNEILAVLAHEVGHWKRKHIFKRIILFELLSLMAAFIAFNILQSDFLADIFLIKETTLFSKLVILSFIFSIIAAPFSPLFSYLSRRHENEADQYAVDLTEDPESLAASLIKLSRDNLSNLHPYPLYAVFHYSHPPVVERVRKIRGISKDRQR
ncbi:MAG: M48 family metallopeptidase [Nitrospiraceae bacterium]|nr:MAG: M48 family metallopeptidase [Nitrospiraceae bacterium]